MLVGVAHDLVGQGGQVLARHEQLIHVGWAANAGRLMTASIGFLT